MMSDLQGRSAFMEADKARYLEVEIEEFGTVRLRNLSAKLMGEYLRQEDKTKGDAWLVWQCVVDSEGRRIFRDDDFEAVQALDGGLIWQIAQAAAAHLTNFGDLEKKVGNLVGRGLTESQDQEEELTSMTS